jgi:hypothetical protein
MNVNPFMFLLSSFRLHYTFETRVQIRLKSGLCELGQAREIQRHHLLHSKAPSNLLELNPATCHETMYSAIDRRVPPTLNEESMIVITGIKLYDLHP